MAVLAVVMVLFIALFQVTSCADAAPGTGAESTCSTELAVGVPAMWVIAVVGAGVLATALWRIARIVRSSSR